MAQTDWQSTITGIDTVRLVGPYRLGTYKMNKEGQDKWFGAVEHVASAGMLHLSNYYNTQEEAQKDCEDYVRALLAQALVELDG